MTVCVDGLQASLADWAGGPAAPAPLTLLSLSTQVLFPVWEADVDPTPVVLSLEETTHREDVLHLSASGTHCTGSFVSPQSHPRRKEARFSQDRFVPSRRTGHPEGPAAAGEVAPGNPQRGGREREAEPPPAYVGPRRGLPGFCFSGPANDLGEKRMPERMALTSQR